MNKISYMQKSLNDTRSSSPEVRKMAEVPGFQSSAFKPNENCLGFPRKKQAFI